MRNDKRLSNMDFDTFHRQGYMVLRDYLDTQTVRRARQISDEMSMTAAAILDECQRTGQTHAERAASRTDELIVVPEVQAPRQVCRYEFMTGSSQPFAELVEDELLPAVSFLLGEPAVVFKDKTNEKMPGGGGFRPHQDFVAYRHFPPRYNVTAMLTIDVANRQNGCVQFADHFAELVLQHPQAVSSTVDGYPILHHETGGRYNGDISGEVAKLIAWSEVETGPADLVLFDSFVPHFSNPNLSNRSRRAIFVTFNRLREGRWYDTYYSAKRANYHDPMFHVSTPTLHGEHMQEAGANRGPSNCAGDARENGKIAARSAATVHMQGGADGVRPRD